MTRRVIQALCLVYVDDVSGTSGSVEISDLHLRVEHMGVAPVHIVRSTDNASGRQPHQDIRRL